MPTPSPTPRPAPAPPPAADWRDWTVALGTWGYRQDERGSVALFGPAGGKAELILRCDRQRGRVFLSRRSAPDAAAGPLVIRTTSERRQINAQPVGGEPPYVAAELGVRDPVLDAIGFSRGRFAVEGAGMPPLVVPPWAEISRVIEDCRD